MHALIITLLVSIGLLTPPLSEEEDEPATDPPPNSALEILQAVAERYETVERYADHGRSVTRWLNAWGRSQDRRVVYHFRNEFSRPNNYRFETYPEDKGTPKLFVMNNSTYVHKIQYRHGRVGTYRSESIDELTADVASHPFDEFNEDMLFLLRPTDFSKLEWGELTPTEYLKSRPDYRAFLLWPEVATNNFDVERLEDEVIDGQGCYHLRATQEYAGELEEVMWHVRRTTDFWIIQETLHLRRVAEADTSTSTESRRARWSVVDWCPVDVEALRIDEMLDETFHRIKTPECELAPDPGWGDEERDNVSVPPDTSSGGVTRSPCCGSQSGSTLEGVLPKSP